MDVIGERTIFGRKVHFYSSTHERSHLWGCYGMSPFPGGIPCYALIWEGWCGDFYEIDEHLQVVHRGKVMPNPGHKYSFLYALADPKFTLSKRPTRMEDAGKLMALSAYGQSGSPDRDEQALIDFLLPSDVYPLSKEDLRNSPYYNIGVTHQKFTNLARRVSDAIFDAFHTFAKKNLTKGYPLLISGGCGLNCEWNRRWLETNLFPTFLFRHAQTIQAPQSGPQSTPCDISQAMLRSNGTSIQASLSQLTKLTAPGSRSIHSTTVR
ncbi:hypothetical protein NKJ51_34060 [Mesorhizobium sp. M0134]|uniref:carbamoyltransferase N-terminal domain-containing protein n=1 Tax=Mesorhizobium sp. M0134 TaxID=2956889 RepID=UPI0033380756